MTYVAVWEGLVVRLGNKGSGVRSPVSFDDAYYTSCWLFPGLGTGFCSVREEFGFSFVDLVVFAFVARVFRVVVFEGCYSCVRVIGNKEIRNKKTERTILVYDLVSRRLPFLFIKHFNHHDVTLHCPIHILATD